MQIPVTRENGSQGLSAVNEMILGGISLFKRIKKKLNESMGAAILLSLFELFVLLEILYISPDYPESVIYNYLLLLPFVGILWLLQLPAKAVYIVQGVILFFSYYLNNYVIASRGRPIHFMDIYSIKDAMKMSGHYPLVFDFEIAKNLFLTAVIVFLCCYAHHQLHIPRIKASLKCLVGGSMSIIPIISILCYRSCGLLPIETLEWDENLYIRKNGLFYAWYCEYENSTIHQPDQYSAAQVSEILTAYTEENTTDTITPDNIIVIMNEAFTDYSLIGETDFLADPLPYIHGLDENCIKGKLYVNIYGGNTCNSEFEFLTGYSLAFLPENSVPYVQYSMQGLSAMPHDMKPLNYQSTAVHPYYAQEWRREDIYADFGFQDFISGEEFSDSYVKNEDIDIFLSVGDGEMDDFGSDLEYVRMFISDAECYRTIQKQLAADAENEQSSFIFSVTIQNHGGYDDETSIVYGDVDYFGTKQNSGQNAFLNLTAESDKAFGEFLTALEDEPEKTVVLMFGDHQPSLSFNGSVSLYSNGSNQYQCNADKYTVPYIMWANYDVDWEQQEMLSVNYLSALLKKNCDLPLTAFDQLRLEAMEEYPVLTCGFAVDKNGVFMDPAEAKSSEILKKYEIVQYHGMHE